MKEYERRLVTDVVTGTVDVRHAAAGLDGTPITDAIALSRDNVDSNSRGTQSRTATEETS